MEDLIRRHPGVNDVAVVGVPDERSGELPRAYVVRKNRNVEEQSIIDYVAERVAPHKKLGAGNNESPLGQVKFPNFFNTAPKIL